MSECRPCVLYIHGFNSSPLSYKCVAMAEYLKSHGMACDFQAPALGQWPGENSRELYTLASKALQKGPVFIIGSSLGGYYGTWLMERLLECDAEHPVKLVLINPAVHPCEGFEQYLGPQKNYHTDEQYELTQEHIEQLRHLEVPIVHRPDQILLLAQTGDEVLDYRKAVAFYHNCPQRVDDGGNHSFEGFEETIPVILSFFGPVLTRPLSGQSFE